MSNKTIQKAKEFYGRIQTYEERIKLQDEFGCEDEPDRERKFYRWIRDNKL